MYCFSLKLCKLFKSVIESNENILKLKSLWLVISTCVSLWYSHQILTKYICRSIWNLLTIHCAFHNSAIHKIIVGIILFTLFTVCNLSKFNDWWWWVDEFYQLLQIQILYCINKELLGLDVIPWCPLGMQAVSFQDQTFWNSFKLFRLCNSQLLFNVTICLRSLILHHSVLLLWWCEPASNKGNAGSPTSLRLIAAVCSVALPW